MFRQGASGAISIGAAWSGIDLAQNEARAAATAEETRRRDLFYGRRSILFATSTSERSPRNIRGLWSQASALAPGRSATLAGVVGGRSARQVSRSAPPARARSVALGGAAFVGGEAQCKPTRRANGLRSVLAAVAAVGDSDPDLHDLVRVVEADDDGRE